MQVMCAEKARLVILKLSINAYFDRYMSISEHARHLVAFVML